MPNVQHFVAKQLLVGGRQSVILSKACYQPVVRGLL